MDVEMKKRSSETRGWTWNVGRMLLSITLALGAVSAWSTSSEAPKAMDELALDALWWGDFEEFERLYGVANVAQERSKSGETSVDLFRTGIGRVMRGGEAGGDAYIAQFEALARQWVSERPDSVLAHLLLVRTLYERAWTYRGGGFAGRFATMRRSEHENRY